MMEVLQGSVVTYCREGGYLMQHRLHERASYWQFEASPGPSLAGCNRDIIASQVALDDCQGIRVPCLVTSRPGSTTKFEVFALTGLRGRDALVSCGVVSLRSVPETRAINFKILDGPSILWSEAKTVHVALRDPEIASSASSLAQHAIDMSKFIGSETRCDCSCAVERFWCFNSPSGQILLFVRLTGLAGSRESIAGCTGHWVCLLVTGRREVKVERLPAHCYVPEDYGCITTCMAACHHWSGGREAGVSVATELMVGTRYLQVVLLRGGIPVHCISMETVPTELAVLEMPGDGIGLIVRTADKALATYRVPGGEGEPREVGRWEEVEGFLVGNFAHLSRDQLLVLFSDRPEEISDFLVTDLSQFSVGSKSRGPDEGSSSSSGPCSESLVSAVRALKVRQRVGEAHLTGLQRELQQKTELVRESLQLLQSLASGTEERSIAAPRDLSLVCVLPGKVEGGEGTSSGGVADSAHSGAPVVTGCWQRLLNGCWTVGVVLKNSSNHAQYQLCLSLVVDGALLTETGQSRVVWTHSTQGEEEEEGSKQPAAKRAKTEGGEEVEMVLGVRVEMVTSPLRRLRLPPGGYACLVAWVTLPEAMECKQRRGVLSGGLVCSWRERDEGESGGVSEGECDSVRVVEVGRVELQERCLTDPSLSCDQQCLQHWNGEAAMPGKWTDFSRREEQDMACLLATRLVTHLAVSSRHTELRALAALLRERLPLPPHCILPCTLTRLQATQPCPHAILCATAVSGEGREGRHRELDGVHLSVSGSGHTATISVLHRDAASLSVLRSALSRCLPDDITLSHPHSSHTHSSPPAPLTRQQTLSLQTCMSAMRKEVGSRRERWENGGLRDAVEETDHAMFRVLRSFNL